MRTSAPPVPEPRLGWLGWLGRGWATAGVATPALGGGCPLALTQGLGCTALSPALPPWLTSTRGGGGRRRWSQPTTLPRVCQGHSPSKITNVTPVTHGPLFHTPALLTRELAHPDMGEGAGGSPGSFGHLFSQALLCRLLSMVFQRRCCQACSAPAQRPGLGLGGGGWGPSGPLLSVSLEPLACPSGSLTLPRRGGPALLGVGDVGEGAGSALLRALSSTIAPGASTLWLKRLPGQQLGPVSANPRQRLGWGRAASQEGGAIPLCSVLYKEEGCERGGLGFPVPPVGSRGPQRC